MATALTACQLTALSRSMERAAVASAAALPGLYERAQQLGIDCRSVDARLVEIRDRLRLLVHLPLRSRLAALLADTHYRSLFETGTTQGSHSLSLRRSWEQAMFGDAYDQATAVERVKYGALDLEADIRGCTIAAQYGSSYLVLRGNRVRWRTTLTAGDSSGRPLIGTLEHCAHLLGSLSDLQLRRVLVASPDQPPWEYFECQFHGDLVLMRDVAALVVGPDDAAHASIPDLARRFARQNRCRLVLLDPLAH